MRKTAVALALAASIFIVAGCTTTPTAPPALDLPAGTGADPALERWWTSFNDPTLTALVDEALANNLDLRAAITRIDLARAQVKLAQKDLYPSVDLGVGASRTKSSEVGSFPLFGAPATNNDFRVELNASYEVDLWGKFRTATRAAQDDLLASRYARETVRTVVAADVARTYFQLLAADAQYELLNDTLKSRNETVTLQRDRYQGGVIGDYDLAQAEAERAAVAADLAGAQRAVAQFESALAVLVGRSPREVFEPKLARDAAIVRLVNVPTVAAGLPSDMLLRRPDIRNVETQLAAGNRRIDVARADYFPSLSLTGGYGSESGALKNLFSGPAVIWSIAASLAQPLIGLKAIEANVEAKTAARDQLVVSYQQTVQTAFKETHDALVANQTMRDALVAQTERRTKLERALDLAGLRYRSGYSPYLEVLDAQRQLLQAQTLQILAARDVRLAVVDLAKALGGGWEYKSNVAAE
ncbi:MAG TPA: efflux transporter outer membrane subunit [Casimicrobiaceae bacterium]|jgi:multidrug efflux system outer membrane protein|nr:efflux transporter outer membrane subunit [Casimicrobiaceae bacterium]